MWLTLAGPRLIFAWRRCPAVEYSPPAPTRGSWMPLRRRRCALGSFSWGCLPSGEPFVRRTYGPLAARSECCVPYLPSVPSSWARLQAQLEAVRGGAGSPQDRRGPLIPESSPGLWPNRSPPRLAISVTPRRCRRAPSGYPPPRGGAHVVHAPPAAWCRRGPLGSNTQVMRGFDAVLCCEARGQTARAGQERLVGLRGSRGGGTGCTGLGAAQLDLR